MENEKRLIDANRAFEKADEVTFMGFRAEERKRHFMDLVSVILDCPTVDAVEVVHGRWLNSHTVAFTEECSECGFCVDWTENGMLHNYNYCPNCGADMRERNTNDN